MCMVLSLLYEKSNDEIETGSTQKETKIEMGNCTAKGIHISKNPRQLVPNLPSGDML